MWRRARGEVRMSAGVRFARSEGELVQPNPPKNGGANPLAAEGQAVAEPLSRVPSSSNPAKDSPKPKDAWDKAAVVSSFLSSVVIAVLGLIVTTSLQKTQVASSKVVADAQLDLAKYNSDREDKLAQSKLTT